MKQEIVEKEASQRLMDQFTVGRVEEHIAKFIQTETSLKALRNKIQIKNTKILNRSLHRLHSLQFKYSSSGHDMNCYTC